MRNFEKIQLHKPIRGPTPKLKLHRPDPVNKPKQHISEDSEPTLHDILSCLEEHQKETKGITDRIAFVNGQVLK